MVKFCGLPNIFNFSPPVLDILSQTPDSLQRDDINRMVALPETVGLDVRNGRNGEISAG
jgi:hypothetical protein